MKVICAWCLPKGKTTVLQEGDDEHGVSHGICKSCEDELMEAEEK